ncbi:hypothetical protein ACWGQ9_28560 [Streptomyces parvus]
MLLLRSTGCCPRTAGRCPPGTPCTRWSRLPGGTGAAWAYQRPYGLCLGLAPAVGRALADLPADLVSSYAPAELKLLLPALGWNTLPPMVPLHHTGTVHYLRADDPGCFHDAENELRWRTEEIAFWAQTHDRPVAWVRAGDHHEREVHSAARRMYSTVGPLLPYAVDPAAGLVPATSRRWVSGRAAGAGPGGAPPLPGLRGPRHGRVRRPPPRPRPRGVRLLL